MVSDLYELPGYSLSIKCLLSFSNHCIWVTGSAGLSIVLALAVTVDCALINWRTFLFWEGWNNTLNFHLQPILSGGGFSTFSFLSSGIVCWLFGVRLVPKFVVTGILLMSVILFIGPRIGSWAPSNCYFINSILQVLSGHKFPCIRLVEV